MGKNKPRKQNNNPTTSHHQHQDNNDHSNNHHHHHHHDGNGNCDEEKYNLHAPSTSSSSSSHAPSSSTTTTKAKGVSKRRGKQVYVAKSEVGLSSFEERDRSPCGGEVSEERIEEGGDGNDDDDDDVLKRLERLKLEVEDVDELSEEQIKINDQAQEDELLALESIYGNNFYILEKRQGLRVFQIQIHIELPGEFPVSAKLKAVNDSSNTEDFLYTFKVEYMSPIVLTCLLPRSYPSHCAPLFTISVQWLHKSRIAVLCSMLDSLWIAQPHQEILYQWVDWLHNSSLPCLGFAEELQLGPYEVKDNPDRRALSGSVSPDVDIPSIKSYNEERKHENFLNGFHECCICLGEYGGADFVRLHCQHFFCVKCMKTYANLHVKEGTVHKLQCPNSKCDGMIPPGLLKRFLGDDDFERWESLMLKNTLDSMPDVVYCPRCQTACLEDEEDHAQCSKCYFSFCTLCRERRHVGISCMTPEMKLQILEERQSWCSLDEIQRRRERAMINDILSEKEALRDAKQCPSCKVAISRTEGCNKMVCGLCGVFFCYKCNQQISGYEHFRESSCALFPRDEIQRWEGRMNARQLVGQIQAQLYAGNGRPSPCPSCRQMNPKMGNNNHMFCWACQTSYCYLCRGVVRRGSQHFGPRGCKQHTAD